MSTVSRFGLYAETRVGSFPGVRTSSKSNTSGSRSAPGWDEAALWTSPSAISVRQRLTTPRQFTPVLIEINFGNFVLVFFLWVGPQ